MVDAKVIMPLSKQIIENHGIKLKELFTKELYRHSEHVAYISIGLAQKFNMSSIKLTEIGIGGYLHDIGKIRIPSEVLNKPSRLNKYEWSIMMQHPESGWEIISEYNFSQTVNEIVLGHHKKLDGSGYPSRAGYPALCTQIVTVADIYDSIHTKRCYHNSKTINDTIETMRKMPGLNTVIIDALVGILQEEYEGLSRTKERAKCSYYDICLGLGMVSCSN